MKILVTGGCGFMGSNFIRFQLQNDPTVEIINLDKLTYAGNLANLADVADNPRYRFVRGDINDQALVDSLMPGVDAVVNYAAETHVDRSIMEPRAFLEANVMGVQTLLDAVRKHNVSRMVHISTDEVFGHVEEGETDEDAPFRPRSPYSASKAAGDHLCHAHFVTYGTPVIVTHSVNYYGPYHFPEKLIPLFTLNLMDGKKVPVYGDGMQVREWIFTEDHCRAIDAILRRGTVGEVYNIGTGERVPNIEITKKLIALTGRDESHIEYVKDRPGHDRRYALNSEKLRRELGWAPQVSFDEGLARTVEWFRQNQAWWEPIRTGEYLKYYDSWYRDQLDASDNV
ncbi:dTDP-glucose 4,6-dehydratase [Candidatus Uhrbacteria bacterium RIFOXYB12_FULL_58_10]|uniref:dTDP-glucose 4,6-dehydratase n=1 Tax=Candidatus Uhrbacteria bacterium RIFOXYB2_FULL_57_15 TaxID=1802422 RepID=A0A1F7W850_9BACT|nr:MAG: dTDP-glucose 4,6-dehydratase [Candidatus Uhrbacteria bacterium RIFOXYB12_FULL_58_10]OGL98387.1 MAG: dTDP-glucose 4,6-dehydratase [Candidatus Uhrbacteria bacterium RIFOXYB2_FULL_57_15]OGM00159.1 MAG: dTDP-glucose 4,6-dehydratase [Candidatus Uhrbacteria bacterium RIFOXYC12_FULL_57_11]